MDNKDIIIIKEIIIIGMTGNKIIENKEKIKMKDKTTIIQIKKVKMIGKTTIIEIMKVKTTIIEIMKVNITIIEITTIGAIKEKHRIIRY